MLLNLLWIDSTFGLRFAAFRVLHLSSFAAFFYLYSPTAHLDALPVLLLMLNGPIYRLFVLKNHISKASGYQAVLKILGFRPSVLSCFYVLSMQTFYGSELGKHFKEIFLSAFFPNLRDPANEDLFFLVHVLGFFFVDGVLSE